MKAFAQLFRELDETNKTLDRIAALERFFRDAPERDRVWMLALFTGRRPKRILPSGKLAQWAAEVAGIPYWLFEESYHLTGDLAETVSLLLPAAETPVERDLADWIDLIRKWSGLPENTVRMALEQVWKELPDADRLPFHKLLSGGLRLGVSRNLVTRALAQHTALPIGDVALKLSGNWHPDQFDWSEGFQVERGNRQARPYPFFLAHVLDVPLAELPGSTADWSAEWKWDGIRVQLIVQADGVELWSRGEEVITPGFPEVEMLRGRLPVNTVLDAELLAMKDGQPMPFQQLQSRLGRSKVRATLLRTVPVGFLAYDLLQLEGEDWREKPYWQRRKALEAIGNQLPSTSTLQLSPLIPFLHWDDLESARSRSREIGAEGLMLKRNLSPYGVGRKRGDWFKYKVDPFTVDAVLLYAQRGHGRRAGLYTDFSFGIWKSGELLPFAKAYSGLTDQELRELNAWIRHNALERSGPVVMLPREWVFELAFEGVARSGRHRSGIALRFPRIHRWRKDKQAHEADSLETLESLLLQLPQPPQMPKTGNLFEQPE